MVRQLLKDGVQIVHIFDKRPPQGLFGSRVKVFTSDIRDYSQVLEAMQGIEIVFHVASYGMSGKEMLDRKLTYEVNMNGTENIIKASLECNVSQIIYTSTYNVVFGGQEIVNQDESYPYYPIEKHADEYSRTKCMAEKLIRQSDGKKGSNGTILHTCALRAAAIYGEKEERHFPRIVKMLQDGMLTFTIGAATVDWVYVDNLVHAHLQASRAILKDPKRIGGNVYFVSDQNPINNWEFLRPLIEGLGYRFPAINLPTSMMYVIAFLVEMMYALINPFFSFNPLLSRAEVSKVGMTHYFSSKKAQDEIEYFPIVKQEEGVQRMVQYWKDKVQKEKREKNWTLPIVIFVIIVGFVFYKLLLS
eukprot:TRINITY_DN1658_c0_g1_i2.p1 TRINITY_DN1658_c0_g1~~TRINITY_DN1658_c0_g1_i2.p1  ORF type:complete len:378 (+),score=112.05 TRINITY_DN1658_c0_g1_i2:57-1136(+)